MQKCLLLSSKSASHFSTLCKTWTSCPKELFLNFNFSVKSAIRAVPDMTLTIAFRERGTRVCLGSHMTGGISFIQRW